MKKIYLILGVFGAVIALVLYFWKGLQWQTFMALETESGRERLRKLVEGELTKKPDELMKVIDAKLNLPPGHEQVARYIIAHWRTTDGQKEFREFILGILESHGAQERMTQLVARYAGVREDAKELAKKGEDMVRDAARPKWGGGAARDRELRASEIGSKITGEPAVHLGTAEAWITSVTRYVREQLKKEVADSSGEKHSSDEAPTSPKE